MPISVAQSDDSGSDGFPPSVPPTPKAPAWLSARLEKQSGAAMRPEVTSPEPVTSSPPALPRRTLRPKPNEIAFTLPATSKPKIIVSDQSNILKRWISRQSTISILISLSIHLLALGTLAFFVVSNVTQQDVVSLWGVVGDEDDSGTDTALGTELGGDSGESAPIQVTTDLGQSMGGLEPAANLLSIKEGAGTSGGGLGGQGHGQGDSGDGNSMGIGSMRIPRHAQTKGSFSAWADPRDPKPNEDYTIVIQVKLPRNVKKYRGSDLSGSVKGTDNYKQEIRFKSGEQFTVEDGSVQIRIRVPGAARLVRDVIHIESKVLREKQEFEIEF